MAPGTDRTQYREVLASLVQQTQTRFPDLNGRLTQATKLALLDDVELHDDGTATVHSASDPTRHYRIAQGTCTCRDWEHAPEHLCQHRLAAGLVRKAHALLPPTLEAAAPQPLPEAPASVNVRLQIDGRDCQLTLRDSDEARLLARLQAVLAQYPVPQAPAQASRTAEGWCAKHAAQMRQTTKEGRSWWSHQIPFWVLQPDRSGWLVGKERLASLLANYC